MRSAAFRVCVKNNHRMESSLKLMGWVSVSVGNLNWIEGSDRQQTHLLPVALEDYVGTDIRCVCGRHANALNLWRNKSRNATKPSPDSSPPMRCWRTKPNASTPFPALVPSWPPPSWLKCPNWASSPNKPPPPWRTWLPTIVTAAARKACANISGGRRPVRCALYLTILHGHENARRFSHRLFSPLQRPHLFNWPFELSAGRVEAG